MMRSLSGLKYYQVDVFSAQALAGNGLTVFLPERALEPDLMQRLTCEMRQFESIFVTPDARPARFGARIFTMEEELDFAGHPILGAAALLHHLHAQQQADARWELMLGARTVQLTTQRREDGYRASMNQGMAVFKQPLSRAQSLPFLEALNLTQAQLDERYPLQVVSTGLPYLLLPICANLERARVVHPAFEALLATVGAKFAYVFEVAAREGRTWDNAGLVEDIATGSAAGPVGAYLVRHGAAATGEVIMLNQGRFVGRPSQIAVQTSAASDVLVSGDVVVVARGELL